MRRKLSSFVAALAACAAAQIAFAQAAPIADRLPPRDISVLNEARHSLLMGCKWLSHAQLPDGSWRQYPGISGLALIALNNSGLPEYGANSPVVRKGLAYILEQVKPDGSICLGDLKSYNTSICLMALLSTRDPKYDETIRRARRFLMASQFDEDMGYGPTHPYFGGIGYGKHKRPDLSNLQWAIEALRLSEYVERDAAKPLLDDPKLPKVSQAEIDGLCYDRAIKFIERCQNRKASNDQPWAGTDGGFVYRPGESKAGAMHSYGSMTYAGLKSFIYAKVDRNDPRVQAAYNWIRKHYTVDKNPGMGLQGLYYNYHTMAKALHIYGANALVDAKGKRHHWRDELLLKLVRIQNGDGYWVNTEGRWWENAKELATSYSLIALEIAMKG